MMQRLLSYILRFIAMTRIHDIFQLLCSIIYQTEVTTSEAISIQLCFSSEATQHNEAFWTVRLVIGCNESKDCRLVRRSREKFFSVQRYSSKTCACFPGNFRRSKKDIERTDASVPSTCIPAILMELLCQCLDLCENNCENLLSTAVRQVLVCSDIFSFILIHLLNAGNQVWYYGLLRRTCNR